MVTPLENKSHEEFNPIERGGCVFAIRARLILNPCQCARELREMVATLAAA
jgi:hypothetical protein